MQSPKMRLLPALTALAMIGGCVGYTSYDPTEGQALDDNPLNTRAVRAVVTESLRFTIDRMPPSLTEDEARLNALAPTSDRPVAVSLPRGMTKSVHDEILTSLGERVEPIVDGNEGLPIYRVGKLRIRGGSAIVDIHRPLDKTDNRFQAPYQCITVNLVSDLEGWRIEDYQAWLPGTVPLPALNALRMPQPETDPDADPDAEPTEVAAEAEGD